jgi:hypothetical protein
VRRELPQQSGVEDLLPEDVSMPAVLGELPEHMQVHPAQGERAAAVAAEHVVER